MVTFVEAAVVSFSFPHSSMYVNLVYFMYDVQYIVVSIIIIVNLFLELIFDSFPIDVLYMYL